MSRDNQRYVRFLIKGEWSPWYRDDDPKLADLADARATAMQTIDRITDACDDFPNCHCGTGPLPTKH